MFKPLTSLVLGTIALVFLFVSPIIGLISGVLGLLIGITNFKTNKKLSTAGICLSSVAVLLILVSLLVAHALLGNLAQNQKNFLTTVVDENYFSKVDKTLLEQRPYTDPVGLFEMQYPKTWSYTSEVPDRGMDTKIRFTGISKDIHIEVNAGPSNATLSKIIPSVKTALSLAKYNFLEERRVKVDNVEAVLWVLSGGLDSKNKYMEFLIFENVGGRIIFTSGTSPSSDWFVARKLFESSFATLHFLR